MFNALGAYLSHYNLCSGYWSGSWTFIPVAIGPAIGHMQGKRQSDSCVYFVRIYIYIRHV